MSKVYISGPMTGLPDYNRDAFKKAEKWCLSQGFSPFNPGWMLFQESTKFSYEEIMQIDLAALEVCDCILLLAGYEGSRGAQIELNRAKELGLSVIYYDDVAKGE